MASTYSTNLQIQLIGTGDQSGAWGVTTNTNLGTLLEQAVSSYVKQQFASGDITLAMAPGNDAVTSNPPGTIYTSGTTTTPVSARNLYIECQGTSSGNNLIVPTNIKLYYIYNNITSGGGTITVKTPSGTGVDVPVGQRIAVVCDGTNIVQAQNYFTGFSNINVTGSTVPANGIYLPSTNTLGFSSNTTQRATVNSAGNWAINAPSSGTTLTLTGSASGAKSLLINGAASGNANIAMANNSGTGTLWWITGSGNMLIGGNGVSEPATAPITITSTGATSITYLNVTGSTIPVNGIYLPAANSLGFATNTTLRATFDASGNLFVGSTSLSTDLSTTTGSANAALFRSAAMTTASTASGTAVTIFAIPANATGVYLIQATLSAVINAPGYTVVGILVTNASSYKWTNIVTATFMTVQISGSNLQATQTSGASAVITATATRFA
jgi:hypothetical protein